MKVYIGFLCCSNDVDVWRNAEKVFKDELAALEWSEAVTATEWEWREYDEYEVE